MHKVIFHVGQKIRTGQGTNELDRPLEAVVPAENKHLALGVIANHTIKQDVGQFAQLHGVILSHLGM